MTCVASGQGLVGKLLLSLCCALLLCSWQVGLIFPVLRLLSIQPNLNFHWLGDPHSLHHTDSLGLYHIQLMHRQRPFGAGRQLLLPFTTVFFGQLSGVWRPPLGGGWPLQALKLLLSGPRLSIGAKSESALTHWTPLVIPCCWHSETLPHLTPIPLIPLEALSAGELYGQLEGSGRFRASMGLFLSYPKPGIVTASLNSQHSLSHAFPGPTKAATNYRLLYSSYQVVWDQSQSAADLGLHRSSFQEVPEPAHQVAGLKP